MDIKDDVQQVSFSSLNLNDPFFNSLRKDYSKFNFWFKKKSIYGAKAYVLFKPNGSLQAFLYLKKEVNEDTSISPVLPECLKLKVGTFKIDAHRTSLGQRFINIILQKLITGNFTLAYVTFYPKQKPLKNLFEEFGFTKWGMKNKEEVYYKDLKTKNNVFKDFPRIKGLNSKVNKYLLGIIPKYHTELFPDSKLSNEKSFYRKDVTFSNTIIKCYMSAMKGISNMRSGDLLVIYRTNPERIVPAYYKSVVTSICTVVETRNINDFDNFADFRNYIKGASIFSEKQLNQFFVTKRYPYIIKMLYNFPLKKRVTNGDLKNNLNISPKYWGCAKLTDQQFRNILEYGKVNENFIID